MQKYGLSAKPPNLFGLFFAFKAFFLRFGGFPPQNTLEVGKDESETSSEAEVSWLVSRSMAGFP